MASRRLPIEVHDLTVSYQKKPVLYGIDLEIEEGSLVGVLGPNGAGKSTLVKSVMNMIKPNGGYVKIFGKDPKEGIILPDFIKSNLDLLTSPQASV